MRRMFTLPSLRLINGITQGNADIREKLHSFKNADRESCTKMEFQLLRVAASDKIKDSSKLITLLFEHNDQLTNRLEVFVLNIRCHAKERNPLEPISGWPLVLGFVTWQHNSQSRMCAPTYSRRCLQLGPTCFSSAILIEVICSIPILRYAVLGGRRRSKTAKSTIM